MTPDELRSEQRLRPDRLRLGLAPLYTRFVDLFTGFDRIRKVMDSGAWRTQPAVRARVT